MIGISAVDYWDLTLQEINDIITAENTKNRQKVIRDYNLASMVAQFVGCSFAGKNIPTINELYPDIMQPVEEDEQKQMAFYIEQFKHFAYKHNALNSKKGANNGIRESSN